MLAFSGPSTKYHLPWQELINCGQGCYISVLAKMTSYVIIPFSAGGLVFLNEKLHVKEKFWVGTF